jgi:predicted dehydrogenase
MNVACCGANHAAEIYLRALARRPDVSLAGIAANDQQAAERLAAGWRAPVFGETETMLEQSCPEALLVCVEPFLQDRAVALAVARRIPFLIEPPGGFDHQTAAALCREVDAAGLVNAVGFRPRFADIVQEARDYVGAHPVPLALGWWLAGRNTALAADEILATEACIMLDTMCRFCGSITQVRALAPRIDGQRNGIIVELSFDSGTSGILACTGFSRPVPRHELELMGADWHLTFQNGFSTLEVVEQKKTTLLRCQNDPVDGLLTEFLASVATGQSTRVAADYGQAVSLLAVSQAVRESIATGREASLGNRQAAEPRG